MLNLPNQITILVPIGTSLRIEIPESDGQFIISNGDPNYAPANQTHEALRIMSDLPDTTGREGVIYEEIFGSQTEEETAEPLAVEAPPSLDFTVPVTAGIPDFSPVVLPPVGSYPEWMQPSDGPSLEQMLANAINKDPETGHIPGEPAPEALERAGSRAPSGQGPSPAPASAPLDGPSEASQEPVAHIPLPASARPMDEAPREGGSVMLLYDDVMGRVEQAGRWSSALGRQFWVDMDGDTLGADSSFLGWRHMTAEEKEEYGG